MIALIQGSHAKTLNDIKIGLGEHWDKYTFKDFYVNILDERQIIQILQEIDAKPGFDLMALFRGGAEDLSVFESTEMGKVVINLRTPIATAIGHAGDEPFIQRISNRSFITPTDFGNYLKEVYINSGREDDLTDREIELKSLQNNLNEKSSQLQSKEKYLTEKTNFLQNRESQLNHKAEKLNWTIEENNKAKQQNKEREKQIESDKIKNRKITIAAAAVLILLGLISGAASYFITAYLADPPKASKTTSADSNLDTKTPFNSKNK